MWWTVLVFNLLALDSISAQDVTNGTETHSKLCCPCPPGWTGDSIRLASEHDLDHAAGTVDLATSPVGVASGSVGVASGSRAALDSVDDCPCRARDADSEGAASVFFPNAVRAFGNVVRPDPKEDSKPLLHPEVDLASSVLETLREATDEEYRDALQRDAARAAVPDIIALDDVITDGDPEEARNVVTIIVSPRDIDTDDSMPEASHVQETRCIHSPLGNPRASFILQPLQRAPVAQKGIEDILNLPLPSGLLHRQRDSNLAASNIHENFAEVDDNLNKLLSRLRLRTAPNVLNLDPLKLGENINNLFNNANSGVKTGNSGLDRHVTADANAVDLANNQVSPVAVQVNDNIDTNILEKSDLDRESSIGDDFDSNISPTTKQDTVYEQSVKNTGLLKSLLLAQSNGEKTQDSFPLKSLFKLKDVELVPLDVLKNVPKTKLNVPIVKIEPLHSTKARNPIKIPTQSILFGKPSKLTTDVTNSNEVNKVKIPRKKVMTEILDAVPSPSEDNCVRLTSESDKSVGIDMEELEDSFLNSSTESIETGDDLSDVMGKENDDKKKIDIFSEESTQLKSSEVIKNNEADVIDDFEIVNDTEPLEQGSDSDIQVISQEDFEDVPSSAVDLSEINVTEDRSSTIPEKPRPFKSLEEIRKSVVDKLNALQKSNKNALDNIKNNVEEISPQDDFVEERSQNNELISNEDEISNVEPTFESPSSGITVENELRDTSTSAESVSFQDLQEMSDSILMASEKHEQRADPTCNESMAESKEDNTESEEISESEIDNVLGMDESQSKESNPKGDLNRDTDNTDVGNAEKIQCQSDLFKAPEQTEPENTSTGVLKNENTVDDLEPLASDPIMNMLRPTSLTSDPILNLLRPNSKSLIDHLNDFDTNLRQSAIVQPTPLINFDDLNIFRTPSFSLPDISGLNANIPTLDEIRTRVSEILDGLARTTSDDDSSSEIDSDDFASEVKPVVSAGGRSSNSIPLLPPLKPLEDINLDIIQLKPIPSILGLSPQKPNLPGLNLNRYKAKLAVPKSIDFKPLNLASTLGNDGGLVGATLSVGPEKKHKPEKPKFKSNSNSDLAKMFRSSENNPTLAEITSSVQRNALNLLNIPKSTNKPILQASNVMQNFAEDIKSRTEDTIRNIHESLNPPDLSSIHNNLLKNAHSLRSSGRSSLGKTLQASTPINAAVDNLRSQTENTIKQLHNTFQIPRDSNLGTAIKTNTDKILKSSRNSVDAAVDNFKAQSENTFRNIQQTLKPSTLANIGDSIHKAGQNILKSSGVAPSRDILGNIQSIPSIDEVAGNIRSHTQNTLKNIQQTLNTPTLSDIGTSIQKSAQHVLNSPITNARAGVLKSPLQPMSIDTVVDNLKSQTQNTMRTIQNSLNTPTLADVSATVQKHAHNLLNSPVAFTGRDAFEQVLQNSAPLNLTPHAEQLAKDLQKTIKATLKNNPIKELPLIPHPNDVIQMISNHQEDVNDKLFAIHTDLNDRLESIHNEVTDPERLRSILSPPGNKHFELFAIPLPMSSRNAPSAGKQSRQMLQSKQPSFAQKKQAKKVQSTTSRPRAAITKLGTTRVGTGKESSPPKSFRIPSAASSPILTHINKPIFPLDPKDPFKGLQGLKKPVLLNPFTKNKVTVTFGPTTSHPALKSKSKEVPTTPKPKVSNNKRFKPKPKPPVRQPTPWNGWGQARSSPKRLEPLTSPSRASSDRVPLKSNSVKSISKPVSSGLSHVSPKLKSPSKSSLKTTPLSQGRASNPSQLLPLNRPRSPLLSKLSEALKAKQTDPNLGNGSRAANNVEMSPAASEHFEKVGALDEHMKENVPYKCKMMCVKVDLNDE